MRFNLLKKVVVGGLITSLCLCCCFLNFNKNVNASAINEYQEQNNWFEDASFLPDEISDINDLKGKTFTIPIMFLILLGSGELDFYINILERDYIGIEIDEETHETIQCIDYLQYPYIIFDQTNLDNLTSEYNIFSFYLESSSNYPFFYRNDTSLNINTSLQLQGSLLSKINNFAYLPIDNIEERNDVPIFYYEFLKYNDITWLANYSNFNFLSEFDFLSNIQSQLNYLYSDFYFVFPNTDRYSLGFNPSEALPFLKNLSFVQPYNANIEDRQIGYDAGYSKGYFDGERNALDNTYRIPFLTGIFNAVSDILALEIFPNVRLGYFVLIPLALGVTGMIFWFWRKD